MPAKTLRLAVALIILTALLVPLSVFAQKDFCQIGSSGKIKVPCPLGSAGTGPATKTTVGSVVLITINVALLIVGSLAVLFLIWGGFRYITAYGNEEQAEAAKRIIKHSILGLVIVILSFTIVAVITNLLIEGRLGVFGP